MAPGLGLVSQWKGTNGSKGSTGGTMSGAGDAMSSIGGKTERIDTAVKGERSWDGEEKRENRRKRLLVGEKRSKMAI